MAIISNFKSKGFKVVDKTTLIIEQALKNKGKGGETSSNRGSNI